MRKILFIFTLLCTTLSTNAQPCITNNITFTSQAQVDDFPIQFPNCTEIQGNVEIDGDADITNLNGLNSIVIIDGDLEIYDNSNLTSLTGLEQLDTITGDLDIIGNGLVSLNGLNNLNHVAGFVYISDHSSLENIDGLNNLSSIGDFFEIIENTALTSVEGLENLETINGHFQLDYNPQLSQLNGLEKLSSVGSYVKIVFNPVLENLDALQNLRHVGETFRIQGNDILNNILGLDGLLSIANNLRIFNNPQLEDCSINILCNSWAIGGDIDIFNNAIGCMDTLDIISKCQEGISGTVYYDFNQNQQRDSFEGGIPMTIIDITSDNTRTFSNINGRYFFTAQEGITYDFEVENNADWTLNSTPSSYTINYTPGSVTNQNNDFGFTPNFTRHDFEIDQFSNATRCNSEVNFYISSKNTGTFLEENGKVEIVFDELYNFVDAYPYPNNIDLSSRTLSWNYSDLYPFQQQQISIRFEMPDETFTGELTEITTSVFRDSLGQLVETTSSNYQSIIRCSYDPNDKLVFPEGEQEEKFTPKDMPLEYTIRFQNTGNDYAWDIEIKDTLDENLNLNTFEVLFTSHELQTSISEDGAISFLFKDIFLPDSSSNFAESQGFVKYRIMPKANLDNFTVIENTAHIYFDANPPIVTNTTINTLVDEIPVPVITTEENIQLDVFPNPTDDILHILLPKNIHTENYELELWDLSGQPIFLDQDQHSFNQIRVGGLPEGFYIISLRSKTTHQLKSMTRFFIRKLN